MNAAKPEKLSADLLLQIRPLLMRSSHRIHRSRFRLVQIGCFARWPRLQPYRHRHSTGLLLVPRRCSSTLGPESRYTWKSGLTAYPRSRVHCCSRDHLEKDDMDTVPSTNKKSWFPGSPRSYRICLSASRVKSAFTERGEKMSFTRNSFFQANSFSQDFFHTLFLWFSTLNKST